MFDAIAQAAARWCAPGYAPRQHVVQATLQAPNRFTPEALAFAISQQMALLEADRLQAWIAQRRPLKPSTVGVFSAGNIPFAGLQDLLAVVCLGHRYLGSVSHRSPVLLPAFAAEAGLGAEFAGADEVWQQADAAIVTGTDDTRAWAESQAAHHGIARQRCLLRRHSYSAAVIDGRECAGERAGLAEDALLHEGLGCRSVALIWAHETLPLAPYLKSFARFRAVFPAHRDTFGRLATQRALLKALRVPHACGAGYLLSRGPPVPQAPGHIRWVPYRCLDDVIQGLAAHRARLQRVYAREGLMAQLPDCVKAEPLGAAQRPALEWQPDGVDTVAFLAALQETR